jgi:putative phosphoesterase
MESPVVTTLADGGRIGILADTHCERGGRRLPAAVFEAFADVQLIIHLGDCGDAGTLDELQRLAPVLATRGFDDAAADARYAAARVLSVAGVAIGALFDLNPTGLVVSEGRLTATSGEPVGSALTGAFGRPVDVVLFGATHAPLVAHLGGVLFANPGSATLPAPPGRGTAAVLEVRGAVASVEIVHV